MRHKRKKVRARRIWREWVRPVIPVIAVLLIVRSAVADWNDVPTGSMKPTILEGDRIFVNKLAYDLKVPFTGWSVWSFDGPSRGDIVVFFSPDNGTRMVKRVVGLPGDTLELRRNRLYVNGRRLDYQPLDIGGVPGLDAEERMFGHTLIEVLGDREHPIMLNPARDLVTRSFGPIQLGAAEYFMMGDNRDNSDDSRTYGLVPRSLIAGQATRVVLSFDHQAWSFRWNRLMRPLR